MKINKLIQIIGLALVGLSGQTAFAETTNPLTAKQLLGKKLFFETRFSNPAGQACASCHAPESAFADPRNQLPVSKGAMNGMFTSRNAPSIMYLAMVPKLHIDKKEGIYMGGLFYDGRAATLEEQVEGPSFGHNEMAIKDKNELVAKLHKLGYKNDFKKVYGKTALANTELAYLQLTQAIAAYERSAELNPFSSKFDYYLQGKAKLSKQEQRGRKVFEDEKKGNCAACHPLEPTRDDGTRPLLTDFSYDNLGVPGNGANPFLKLRGKVNPEGTQFVDLGLGKTVARADENGKFRVPSLRNVAVTAPYMHNGVFSTLKEVVDFYNTRDVDDKWGKPEVAKNVNKDELGDLKLTEQEVEDLVAFMKTFTDGYKLSSQ